jgi:hypothetical protein
MHGERVWNGGRAKETRTEHRHTDRHDRHDAHEEWLTGGQEGEGMGSGERQAHHQTNRKQQTTTNNQTKGSGSGGKERGTMYIYSR